MGNLSRKAALGVTAVFITVTATIAVAGSAGASTATMAPPSGTASVTLAAPASPAGPTALVARTSTAAAAVPAVLTSAKWASDLYWPVVRRGDRSVRVVDLQCLLRQHLGVWLPCNTRFNWATEKDVRLFQWKHGLNPSGQVGPQTWSRLLIKVRYGNRNLAVLAAQASLCMAYRYPITIDGIFGPRTLAAVKDFQRKYGLKPDGVVGLTTWEKMVRFEW
jgi:peptidoglycan hydrolase-like protein with peptidoglycan-binding domain